MSISKQNGDDLIPIIIDIGTIKQGNLLILEPLTLKSQNQGNIIYDKWKAIPAKLRLDEYVSTFQLAPNHNKIKNKSSASHLARKCLFLALLIIHFRIMHYKTVQCSYLYL